jgi:hypothetical protein
MDQGKVTHSGDTLRHPLNLALDINNKMQNYKISTVWGVLVGGGRGNEGD